MWSGSEAAYSDSHYAFDLYGGSFYNPHGTGGHVSAYALTVRCVPGFGYYIANHIAIFCILAYSAFIPL